MGPLQQARGVKSVWPRGSKRSAEMEEANQSRGSGQKGTQSPYSNPAGRALESRLPAPDVLYCTMSHN